MNLDVKCPNCLYSVPLLAIKTFEEARTSPPSVYSICQCPREKCKFVFFVTYKAVRNAELQTYPNPNSDPEFLSDSIPYAIREDLAEAYRCYHAHAYRAVISLCRRAMVRLMREKTIEGTNLMEQSAELFKAGLITASLKAGVDSVAYFTAYGTSPDNDGLLSPTQADAEEVLVVTLSVLEDIFVRPAKVSQLAARKK